MFNASDFNRVLTILNPQDEEFLRTKTKESDITKIDKKELEAIIKQMRLLMKQHQGVGLSANQIGLSLRLFIAQLPSESGGGYSGKFFALLNPKIIASSTKKTFEQEGCLSVPEVYGEVERPYKITIQGYDKNLRPVEIRVQDFLARIMQHELDHLNGILFTDVAENIIQPTEEHE